MHETYEAFKHKYDRKHPGASKGAVDRAWRQHVAERHGGSPRGAPDLRAVRQAQQSVLSQEKSVERAARKSLQNNKFFKAMLDPFAELPVPPPAFEGVPTVQLKVEQTFDVYSNANGEACIFVRPAIQGAIALTNSPDNIATVATGPQLAEQQVIYNAAADNINLPEAAPWTLGGGTPCVAKWQDLREASALANEYTDYVITAAAAEFEYSGALIDKAGDCYTTLLPGAFGAPYMENSLFTLRPSTGEMLPFGRAVSILGSDGIASGGPSVENISPLSWTKHTAVPESMGERVVWHPGSPDVLTDWRPTRYMPYSEGFGLDAISDTYVDGAANTFWILPPVCPGGPDRFRTFHDSLASLNPWLDMANAANAPIAIVSSLYGANITTASTATNAANMAIVAQRRMHNFQSTVTADGDNIMMMMYTGLPQSQKVGTVTVVFHITASVESRAMRPVSHNLSAGATINTKTALLAMQGREHAYMPAGTDNNIVALKKAKEGVLSKGASVIADVVKDAMGAASTISSVWDTAMPVVSEIGAFLAALL